MAVAPADARVDGVLVAPMRGGGLELFVGCTRDPQWGPVIAVGLGRGVGGSAAGCVAASAADRCGGGGAHAGRNCVARSCCTVCAGMPAADIDAVAEVIARIGDAAVALGDDAGCAGGQPAVGARLGCGGTGRAGGLAARVSSVTGPLAQPPPTRGGEEVGAPCDGPEPVRQAPRLAGRSARHSSASTATNRRSSAADASGQTRRRSIGRSCWWITATSRAPFRANTAASARNRMCWKPR